MQIEHDLKSLRTATIVLSACAVLVLLTAARAVLVPVLFAILLALVLTPPMRGLRRRHVPAPLAAGLLLGVLVAGGAWGVGAAARPAAEWISQTPQVLEMVRTEVARVRKFLTKPQRENATLASVRVREADKPQIVDAEAVLTAGALGARKALFGLGSALILCYFMLIGGRAASRTAIALIPDPASRRVALRWTDRLQRHLTRYLTTVTIINIGLGAATAGVLFALGMPNALFLGALVAVLNYVPFLGAFVSAGLLATAGMMAFGAGSMAFAAPALFLGLHLIESQLVTPMVLGRTLTLNPLFVMLALLVMGTLWGIGGAFLAVPLLITARISLASIPALRGWAHVIGRRRPALARAEARPANSELRAQ